MTGWEGWHSPPFVSLLPSLFHFLFCLFLCLWKSLKNPLIFLFVSQFSFFYKLILILANEKEEEGKREILLIGNYSGEDTVEEVKRGTI